MSDAAIQRCYRQEVCVDEWLTLLDAWGGTAHNHTEIARHVHEAYGIDGGGEECHRRLRACLRHAGNQRTA